jgi:hypothetical protein
MPDTLRAWALKGAQAELTRIFEVFPELRPGVPQLAPAAPPDGAAKRGRRPMSEAARKAHSKRMKAFWKARREAKGGK